MKVIREISRGGFGRVEEVKLANGEHYARKIFNPAFLTSSEYEYQKLVKRFQREVRVQSALKSSSFIPVVKEELNDYEPYYLMPLAEKNLYQEIQESKKSGIVPRQALSDVLNALEELHELGYVHRDLKPANVLFLKGLWKLSDFGLVLPPEGTTTKLTSIDSNWGTASYCAPEQSIEFRNATFSADIYAFGCILHDIYGNRQRVPYQRYSAPGEIGGIIEKCTEIRPEKRFQSVRALRGVLLTLLSSAPTITPSPEAADWLEAVSEVTKWDSTELMKFIRFLSNEADESDRYTVLRDLNEEALTHINLLDTDLFKTIASIYCEWIGNSDFAWDFCDVLIRRLEQIFELGDIECKANVVLAAVQLGKKHHRFFVMRRVIQMCGTILDDIVARRIVIEINAQEQQSAFINFVKVLDRDFNEYHPRIAELLTQFVTLSP
ncbi:MAG: protein kinase [Pleurocapsa minor HA4230-MV1]|jgi:serine/threonine protein kinase|nr:protein kinase [Pleurocapsa minor HA4230-MV1]